MPETNKPTKPRRMSQKELQQRYPDAALLLKQVVAVFKQKPDVESVEVVITAKAGQR